MTETIMKELLSRTKIADYIVARLEQDRERLREEFVAPNRVPACYVDELLPEAIAREMYSRFPPVDSMVYKNTLRERKYVSAQMDRHDSFLEETVYAFQDQRILSLIEDITLVERLEPDIDLYAGGISTMLEGHYLRTHLDNSHDKDQERYRVLNLLYYLSPGWTHESGGNLELWDEGPRGRPREIVSCFNRLIIMATTERSWHSVSEVQRNGSRCCVSNYYFSDVSPEKHDYFHATSFRGRPEERLTDTLLRGDNALRTAVRRVLGSKVFKNPHVYIRTDRER